MERDFVLWGVRDQQSCVTSKVYSRTTEERNCEFANQAFDVDKQKREEARSTCAVTETGKQTFTRSFLTTVCDIFCESFLFFSSFDFRKDFWNFPECRCQTPNKAPPESTTPVAEKLCRQHICSKNPNEGDRNSFFVELDLHTPLLVFDHDEQRIFFYLTRRAILQTKISAIHLRT